VSQSVLEAIFAAMLVAGIAILVWDWLRKRR